MISKLNWYLGGGSPRKEYILESSDIALAALDETDAICFYARDTNIYLRLWPSEIEIIDLTNAFRKGKECTAYTVYATAWKDVRLCEKLQNSGILTLSALYDALKYGTLHIEGLEFKTDIKMGARTYSPFVKTKPIKSPVKWTRAHIWKAILSGQIYRGTLSKVRFDPEMPDFNEWKAKILNTELTPYEMLNLARMFMCPSRPNDHDSISIKFQSEDETVIEYCEYYGLGQGWMLYFAPDKYDEPLTDKFCNNARSFVPTRNGEAKNNG